MKSALIQYLLSLYSHSDHRDCRLPNRAGLSSAGNSFKWISVILMAALVAPAAAQAPMLSGDDFIAEVKDSVTNINTKQFQSMILAEPNLQVIDVRMPEELAALGGYIDAGEHPLNINRGWLEFRVAENVPDKSTPIVVYCGINQRSPLAAATLMRMGYKNVYNYSDGFFTWRDAQLPIRLMDDAPGTMLFRKPIEVAPGIWTAIGATAPPTYENSGHNNNLTFIVTSEGVVVVNAGDNYLLAQALHREIKTLTHQPVKFVVLENGQGHAMLGSNYWQEQGAVVIAHQDAAEEIMHKGQSVIDRMRRRNRDKAMGTQLTLPDETFADIRVIELGGERIELRHLGPTHSPGDIVTWLPKRKLVISGDMAFHQRLLPVFEDTDTAGWIQTWEQFAGLEADIVIPGHGNVTNMHEVTTYTVGYLLYMRSAIAALLEQGGSLIDAYKIDQSAYRHLDTFNELAGLNADRIFRAMEFE